MQLLHILRLFKSIESALVNIEHQSAMHRCGSILTQASRNLDALFQGVKCVNKLTHSTSCDLVPQHITDILCSVLKMYVIYWYNAGV